MPATLHPVSQLECCLAEERRLEESYFVDLRLLLFVPLLFFVFVLVVVIKVIVVVAPTVTLMNLQFAFDPMRRRLGLLSPRWR